jgi:hypothetical protein
MQSTITTSQVNGTVVPLKHGRRGHPVIDEIPGLAAWMEAQFLKVPRPTFREIATELTASEFWPLITRAGHATGRSSIHAYWKNWQKRRATRVARALIANNDPLGAEAGVSSLANAAIAEEFEREYREHGLTKHALALIALHGKHQASSARREAERRAAGEVERRALEKARDEMVATLREHPEALRVVLEAIDRSATVESEDPKGEQPTKRRRQHRCRCNDRLVA